MKTHAHAAEGRGNARSHRLKGHATCAELSAGARQPLTTERARLLLHSRLPGGLRPRPSLESRQRTRIKGGKPPPPPTDGRNVERALEEAAAAAGAVQVAPTAHSHSLAVHLLSSHPIPPFLSSSLLPVPGQGRLRLRNYRATRSDVAQEREWRVH